MRSFILACTILALAPACYVRDHRGTVVTSPGWVELGERWVNGAVDRDVIHVGRAEGRFTRLQVVVENSALEMFDMAIVFGNGEVYSPQTRLVFAQGTTTRVIDLPGGARNIRRVEFRYGNLPGGGRARVALFGA